MRLLPLNRDDAFDAVHHELAGMTNRCMTAALARLVAGPLSPAKTLQRHGGNRRCRTASIVVMADRSFVQF